MVRGIRKVLCFETESRMFLVGHIRHARDAFERVAGIKLHSRFRGEDSEHTAAFCVPGKGRLAHFTRSAIQNIILIVATREFKLLIVCADSCSDRCELTKIKWRASNRSQLANWDARIVRRREVIGIDHDFLIEHGTAAISGKIELRMIRQVQDCRLGRDCRVFDA